MFWSEAEEAGRWQREALGHATVSVGNLEECAVAVGDGEPDELADRLLDLGLDLAVVKLGPEGVLVSWEGGRSRVEPVKVTVVNGLGAGDALVPPCAGWDATKTVRFANAGAYVAARLACADAMPDEEDVMELLQSG